jgi:transcriptional regulator with XRE-family HTH domain
MNQIEIGKRIALRRVFSGWSQTELAKNVPAKQTQVSEWEKGSGISETSLKNLAEALGTSIEFLVTGVDSTIDSILLKEITHDYFGELRGATQLWISGLNLVRLLPTEDSIIQEICSKPSGRVKAVLLDPDDESACRYGAAQEYGDARMWVEYKATINLALEILRSFDPAKVDLKVVRYPLNFALDIVDYGEPASFVYVRYLPLRTTRSEMPQDHDRPQRYEKVSDQPIIKFNRSAPEHEYWYNFYVRQFFTIWDIKDGWPSLRR